MEVHYAVETRRPVRETAAQRLARHSAEFFSALARLLVLTAILAPLLLAAFLTADLQLRAFDPMFGDLPAVRPSNWLTRGGFIMALVPFVAILFARRVGGDEASHAVTAAWGVAALGVLAELSFLAPVLEADDFPSARFAMVFAASAMAAQYVAIGVYDVARGGDNWWRAPFYGAVAAGVTYAVIYFPGVYWGAPAPWLNWLVGDLAIKLLLATIFLGLYGLMRGAIRPRGGFGGI